MGVIRRMESPKTGEITWQIDYVDTDKKRVRKTFKLKREAKAALSLAKEQPALCLGWNNWSVGVVGIYMLMKDSGVVYVGKSTNFLARVGGHIRGFREKFDSFCFFPVETGNVDAVERYLIKKLQPKLNRVGK